MIGQKVSQKRQFKIILLRGYLAKELIFYRMLH